MLGGRGTDRSARRNQRDQRNGAPVDGTRGAVSLLGAAAPGIDRVLLVAALLAICAIQTQLARA